MIEKPPVNTVHGLIVECSTALRTAIFNISITRPSGVRMLIDSYLSSISPSRQDEGDSRLPVSVRRHVRDCERCAVEGRRDDLLLFHIGNAVLAYYDALQTRTPLSVGTLRKRVKHLTEIARLGFDSFRVTGDVSRGFYLFNPLCESTLKDEDAVPNSEIENGRVTAGGGGRSSGPPPLQR